MEITEILDIEDPAETNEKGEKIHWIIVESNGEKAKLAMTFETMNILKAHIKAYTEFD